MDYLTFLAKLTSDSTLQSDLYTGAFYLTLMYQFNQDQTTGSYGEGSEIYNWWNLTGTTVRGKLPVKLKQTGKAAIDMYTLESDRIVLFGNMILGVESTELPVFSPCKTLIGDILGAMFVYMLKDNPEIAYAFLQAGLMLLSTYESNELLSSRYNRKGLQNYD